MNDLINIRPLTDIDVARVRKDIEDGWARRASLQGLKYGTAKYRDREIEYFVGAMAALQAVHGTERLTPLAPPSWTISPMCGRCIVDKDAYLAAARR